MAKNSRRSKPASAPKPINGSKPAPVAESRQPVVIAFDERLRFDIPEASALLKQSRAKTYTDIAAGTLKVIKDGRRVYVPGSEIVRRSTLPVS